MNEARGMAVHAGWGRIHVQKIPIERAAYLAKYIGENVRDCPGMSLKGNGARCRVRTCDPYRVKVMLYH